MTAFLGASSRVPADQKQVDAEMAAHKQAFRKWLDDPKTELLARLRSRWLDEREYEDFAEYSKLMETLVPEGYTFVKASKRPFGFTCSHPTMPPTFVALFYVTGTSKGVKFIKR